MKNIVIYWNQSDPQNFGKKKSVYFDFFTTLSQKGANLFIALGEDCYLGNSKFKVAYKFLNGQLEKADLEIEADGIYDRSGGIGFPEKGMSNVLNSLEFKILCRDKWQSYLKFSQFSPRTFRIDKDNHQDILNNFKSDEKVVIKPVDGMKGRLVEFFNTSDKDTILEFLKNNLAISFIVQEFIDTSKGIDGLINSYHDMRVVCLNKEIIWSHIRTPKEGDLKANVAQGGSITEIMSEAIPEDIKELVAEVSKSLYQDFNNPFFSVDIAYGSNGPKILELNSQIGFPLPTMKNKDNFIEVLSNRLLELSR